MAYDQIEPMKVKGSRGKAVFVLLLCLMMFFGSFSFVSTDPIWASLSIILFGPLSVLALVLFVRPQTMLLDAEGFTMRRASSGVGGSCRPSNSPR